MGFHITRTDVATHTHTHIHDANTIPGSKSIARTNIYSITLYDVHGGAIWTRAICSARDNRLLLLLRAQTWVERNWQCIFELVCLYIVCAHKEPSERNRFPAAIISTVNIRMCIYTRIYICIHNYPCHKFYSVKWSSDTTLPTLIYYTIYI